MKIHVAARNEEYARQFSQNNPDVLDVVLHRGVSSLFKLLQNIIDGDDDYALFVHDDVFLPSAMNMYVSKLIDVLNADWPNWGICGNAGIAVPTLTGNSRACRYLFDPHGGPSLGGYVLPAETVDGNTILINCRALRQANVDLPKFEGFQFYDICLSIETLSVGLAVLIAPDLASYHDSKGNQSEFEGAFASIQLVEYLSSKLSNTVVHSLNGLLELPLTAEKNGQFDIGNAAIKNASVGRPKAKIAFVIRSRFHDANLILRAVTSTLDFATKAENQSIRTYIVRESTNLDTVDYLPNNVSVIEATISPPTGSRNLLIKEAINSIEENFVLFLDDNAWVFLNNAEYVSDLLTCLPLTANLVVESHTFSEMSLAPREAEWKYSAFQPQQQLSSHNWPMNFTGRNYVPMCSAFYSREILLQQPSETYDKITYYEEYTASIYALLNVHSIFFSTPKVVSGISTPVLNDGIKDTVNYTETIQRNRSKAELAHHICVNKSNNIGFSLGEAFAGRSTAFNNLHIVGKEYSHLSWLDKKSIACSRFIHGLLVLMVHPRDYTSNLKSISLAIKAGGIRGAVRTIADMREPYNSRKE